MSVLSGLARLVKEGKKFKVSMLAEGLVWDSAYASPSPARRYVPSVRMVRKRYLETGDYATFILDLDEAIRVHGLQLDDLIW
jgi:hypothetical protein